MKRLVLHHRYRLGLAWDLSGFDNHGTPRDIVAGSGDFDGSFKFDRPSSRIDVPPADSLNGLGGFRCSVLFHFTGDPDRRHNLVESQLSFAFFIEKGHRLMTTIRDVNGQWNGVTGPPIAFALTPGWHRADCGHDGVSTSWVAFDGKVMARAQAAPGPLRPVGPRGLCVGHWPEAPDKYAFDGHIAEVWLWRSRPDPAVDDCCVDREALARAEAILRADGWDLAALHETTGRIAAAAAELRRAIPDAGGPSYDLAAAKLKAAVRDQRWKDVGHLAAQLRDQANSALGPEDLERLADDVMDAVGGLLGDRALIEATQQALLCDKPPPPREPRRSDVRWTPWGNERDPAGERDPGTEPDDVPPDVGFDPAPKPPVPERVYESSSDAPDCRDDPTIRPGEEPCDD